MGSKEQGANAIEGRWLTIPRSLCFVTHGDDVLLMKRAAHKRIFPNRYNGVGGHVERDEDLLTSAKREVTEETGLHVRDVRLRAIYNVDANESTGIMVFAFTAVSDNRNFTANNEGTLHWIPKSEVLQYDLVDDLPIILPRILKMGLDDIPLFVHLGYDTDDRIRLRFADVD
jgi:8-oxo-dGTP diphosphatase